MILMKNLGSFIFKIIIALLLILIYWFLGGIFPWFLSLNVYTSVLSCLIYVSIGFLFFTLKSSKYNGIYGALEVTLGLATFFVPFFFKLGIPDKFSEGLLNESFTSYIAFYSGIYLQVRGFESIYKSWKQNPLKYGWVFNTMFNFVKNFENTIKEVNGLHEDRQVKKKKVKRQLLILILFVFSIFLSFLVFSTITGNDINNVYYIFSTGAQTLAALVGLVLAAYTFNHQFMWNARDSSEGTSEIIDETIQKYYNYIKVLSIATGFTLIGDIFMLQFNAIQTSVLKPIIYIIIGSMNVCVIIAAFLIALHIIRPINIEEWARKLFEERIREKERTPELTVNKGEYIDSFISLETMCRNYLNINQQTPRHVGMGAMARNLFEREIIDRDTFDELLEVNRYRNLVVHGHIPMVEQEMYNQLRDLTQRIEFILKKS